MLLWANRRLYTLLNKYRSMRTYKMENAFDQGHKKVCQAKRVVLLILNVTTVIQLLALLGLVIHWRVLRSEVMTSKEQQMCLALHKFTDEEAKEQCPTGLRKEFDEKKNATTCCGRSSNVLDSISTEVVSKKYNGDAYPEMIAPDLKEYHCKKVQKEQPEANIIGLSSHKNPGQVGMAFKLFWNTESPSYAHSGLRHVQDDGSIYVETNGTYYISTQLKTKVENTNNTKEGSDTVFRHYVHLISKDGTGADVLENAKSLCEMMSEASESTSVLGAVFQLERGDRLYVATSHPENIVPDPHDNYFSMHII